MSPTVTTEAQYGVRYPDGVEDWNTRSWFGHIETPEMRANFQEQYDLRLRQFGLPTMAVAFLTRTVTTSVSETAVIDEPAWTPPMVEPPAADEGEALVDDNLAAAPDEDVALPATLPVVEEESPVDTGEGQVANEKPSSADNEGDPDHGR